MRRTGSSLLRRLFRCRSIDLNGAAAREGKKGHALLSIARSLDGRQSIHGLASQFQNKNFWSNH